MIDSFITSPDSSKVCFAFSLTKIQMAQWCLTCSKFRPVIMYTLVRSHFLESFLRSSYLSTEASKHFLSVSSVLPTCSVTCTWFTGLLQALIVVIVSVTLHMKANMHTLSLQGDNTLGYDKWWSHIIFITHTYFWQVFKNKFSL